MRTKASSLRAVPARHLFACLLMMTASFICGCSTLKSDAIHNYDDYIRMPVGSMVSMEGTVIRYAGTDESAMLLLKNGDRMPLGGRRVVAMLDGEYAFITGLVKTKHMPIISKPGSSSKGMAITLKYVDVIGYRTKNK